MCVCVCISVSLDGVYLCFSSRERRRQHPRLGSRRSGAYKETKSITFSARKMREWKQRRRKVGESPLMIIIMEGWRVVSSNSFLSWDNQLCCIGNKWGKIKHVLILRRYCGGCLRVCVEKKWHLSYWLESTGEVNCDRHHHHHVLLHSTPKSPSIWCFYSYGEFPFLHLYQVQFYCSESGDFPTFPTSLPFSSNPLLKSYVFSFCTVSRAAIHLLFSRAGDDVN